MTMFFLFILSLTYLVLHYGFLLLCLWQAMETKTKMSVKINSFNCIMTTISVAYIIFFVIERIARFILSF